MAPRENGGGGDFAGIDPARMRAMIKDLTDGKAAVEAKIPGLKESFEKVGLSTKPIATLAGIAAWIGGELPMLNRRHAMAEQLAKENAQFGLGSAMVPGESGGLFASKAEAEAKAKELAAKYQEPGGFPAEVWAEVAKYRRDPDFAAAFLRELGAERAAWVTARLRTWGEPGAEERLETFATLTATASHQGVITEQWLEQFDAQGQGPNLYDLGALITYGIWDAATLRAIGTHALKGGHLLGGADVTAELLDAIARNPLAAHELYEANFDRINAMAAGTVPGWNSGDGPKGDALGRFLTAATLGAHEIFERGRPAGDEKWANPAEALIRRMVDAVSHGAPSPFAGVREAHAKAVQHVWKDPRRKAAWLARELDSIPTMDAAGAARLHRVAEQLTAHAGDPAFHTAFWSRVDPRWTALLADFLDGSGSETAAADLKAFSVSFGKAVSSASTPPELARLKEIFLTPPGAPGVAWHRLALLQYGDFPADFRTAAAKKLALDAFFTDPDAREWRGGGHASGTFGLPEDTVALALRVLAGDAAAARSVLRGPDDWKKIMQYAKGRGTGDEVADAFGRAAETAAGVHTEQPGRHSPEAAKFTFDLMRYLATIGADTPRPMADSLAEIAKSYRHELLTGARFDDGAARESSMTAPRHFSAIPGVTPAFFLGQRDTYDFLKTFAADPRLSDIRPEDGFESFDEVMARFRHDVLVQAARVDADAIRKGKGDPAAFQEAAGAFGDLAGLEYRAQAKVRGDMDEFDKKVRGVVKDIATLGLDRLPDPRRQLMYWGWETTKFGVGKVLDGWVEGDEEATRAGEAAKQRSAFINMARYEMAGHLINAGYPAQPPPPAEFLTADGSLKSVQRLHEEAKTEAAASGGTASEIFQRKLADFFTWADSTDREGSADTFDKKLERGSDAITSAESQEAAAAWDK